MMKQSLVLAQKPHVVIATPGRLTDHLLSTDTFSLQKIKFLVCCCIMCCYAAVPEVTSQALN